MSSLLKAVFTCSQRLLIWRVESETLSTERSMSTFCRSKAARNSTVMWSALAAAADEEEEEEEEDEEEEEEEEEEPAPARAGLAPRPPLPAADAIGAGRRGERCRRRNDRIKQSTPGRLQLACENARNNRAG